ncbi:MAG: toll/interleukin-1 receptor domain-containing protein [Candidatus Cybelea sp.]
MAIRLDLRTGQELHAYSGRAIGAPARIAVISAGSDAAEQLAATLVDSLLRELSGTPGVTPLSLSAGREVDFATWLEDAPKDELRLIVAVGDDSTPIDDRPQFSTWRSDPSYGFLPIFPASARRSVQSLLPESLRPINAAFWWASVAECLPRVLQAAGIVDERSRVFISYRQTDYPSLAIQLFDALARRNFDTFLDSFRIDPGVDFQERLTEELGNKGVVVVLESPGILDSTWTRYEAMCAKKYGLGLIGILTPDGVLVPEVDEERRVRLIDSDFTNAPLSSSSQLNEETLSRVVERIVLEHSRLMLWRQAEVRDSIVLALEDAGLKVRPLGPGLVVQTASKQYMISCSPRPPESLDFERTGNLAQLSAAHGVLVGLYALMRQTSHQHVNWLSSISGVAIVDEGDLMPAAQAIAGDAL